MNSAKMLMKSVCTRLVGVIMCVIRTFPDDSLSGSIRAREVASIYVGIEQHI